MKYLVIIRDDFLQQLEARPLRKKSLATITKFFQEDIIYYYRLFSYFIIDRGLENLKDIIILLNYIRAKRIRISPYNSRVNNVVKRGYYIILEALLKIIDSRFKRQINYLSIVLLIKRVITYYLSRYNSFFIVYRRDYILSIKS